MPLPVCVARAWFVWLEYVCWVEGRTEGREGGREETETLLSLLTPSAPRRAWIPTHSTPAASHTPGSREAPMKTPNDAVGGSTKLSSV